MVKRDWSLGSITSVSIRVIRVIRVISGRVLAWKTETQIVEPNRIELDSATT